MKRQCVLRKYLQDLVDILAPNSILPQMTGRQAYWPWKTPNLATEPLHLQILTLECLSPRFTQCPAIHLLQVFTQMSFFHWNLWNGTTLSLRYSPHPPYNPHHYLTQNFFTVFLFYLNARSSVLYPQNLKPMPGTTGHSVNTRWIDKLICKNYVIKPDGSSINKKWSPVHLLYCMLT